MRSVARGALLLSLLPASRERAVTASGLSSELRKLDINLHVRSVQRDLESLPAWLVELDDARKPYRWWRRSSLSESKERTEE